MAEELPPDLSRIRQQILQAERARRKHVQTMLRERGPMVRGSFVRQKRRCGRPSCRCARGELHEAAILTRSEEGEARSFHVPRADRLRVEAAAGRYRRFRRARAELAAQGRQVLEQLDTLQRALTEPYPTPEKGRGKKRAPRRKRRSRQR